MLKYSSFDYAIASQKQVIFLFLFYSYIGTYLDFPYIFSVVFFVITTKCYQDSSFFYNHVIENNLRYFIHLLVRP
jgi:hypothetical protein